MKHCTHCKAIIEDDAVFCPNCGRPVPEKSSSKMGSGIIIGILATIAVIATAAAAILFFMPKSEPQPVITPEPIVITVTPEPTATPAPTAVPRRDLYNPALTYKRLKSVHNSAPVDNSTYEALRTYIFDFNRCCTTYMNYGSNEIFVYLPEGTSAYKSQTSYKKNHPTLTQEYDYIDVVNARYSGNYYYVWVAETITSQENGKTKTATSHWVYELVGSDGSWYINDYIPDPAF